ncbi:hypothetical protein DFH08DRAFT_826442 [Mycena albidolilacea]|uniref:Uncharacterized protein n=1 Tax=Mycena albidolilacea TaxID=1033008 RepID=A0AAD6Z069_9AGAR|nr:hypothetical protein DFH08DRAFT_826442 [Mycena albidolilacea]
MAPLFTSAPTKHVVRPLLTAPCPVTLPVLLTNIIPEQFLLPCILMDIDPSRTPSPPPPPPRARTPAPAPRACTPAPVLPRRPTPDSRESSLTSMASDDEARKPCSSNQIARPSAANIQTVKSLFREHYPNLTLEEQEKQYTDFRARLDQLCTLHLRPSLALSYQDKEKVTQVHTKKNWPVMVCLQGKLHNSSAHAVEKSTRKVVNAIAGAAPAARASSKKPKNKS